jgi:hypothetical protein
VTKRIQLNNNSLYCQYFEPVLRTHMRRDSATVLMDVGMLSGESAKLITCTIIVLYHIFDIAVTFIAYAS